MFNSKTFGVLMILMVTMVAGSALAGANITVNDHSTINLGYRLQAYYQAKDMDLDSATDGYETMTDFSIRRARFRLKGNVTPKVSIFLQTDVSGKSMQMIDAFVNYKADPWAQFIMGRNMAPASRQALTSSGALLAMDRPGQVYNALNWGARYKYGFNGSTFPQSLPLGGDAVRDNGLTLFGSGPVGENGHLKYYAGIYNGIQDDMSVDDKDHFAFRAQYNMWDAEGGYYNSSTYLGKKKTLALGISYDLQDAVSTSAAPVVSDPDILVDYSLLSADLFLELPSSNGNSFTFEGALNVRDFGDAIDYMDSQGTGFYTQAAYYLASGFQPWFLFESFSSDATENADGQVPGDYTSFRVGATYFIDGQHANVKLGYESFKPDVPMTVGGTTEDTINSFTLGFFVNY